MPSNPMTLHQNQYNFYYLCIFLLEVRISWHLTLIYTFAVEFFISYDQLEQLCDLLEQSAVGTFSERPLLNSGLSS